jgi:acyl-coenzyme A thioesterase PaaI-like protein
MALADQTCGGTSASVVPEDREVITVENKISFFAPGFRPGFDLSR